MCAQRSLKSAWASAQSDQSLPCLHEERLGPELPIERKAKTLITWADAQADLSFRWAHRSFCWFCHAQAQYKFCHKGHFYTDTVLTLQIDHDDICTILHVSMTSMWNKVRHK